MAFFTVEKVIDERTLSVVPAWRWKGYEGTTVRPLGLGQDVFSELNAEVRTCRLKQLLEKRSIVLGFACRIEQGCLICDVFLEGQPIEQYMRSANA